MKKAKTTLLILGILQAISIIGLILSFYVWIWSGFTLWIKTFLTFLLSSVLIWQMFKTVNKIVKEEEKKLKNKNQST